MSFSTFELPSWADTRGPKATHVLAGSYAPARSINDLIKLSSEPQTTASNLNFTDLKLTYNTANTGQTDLKSNIASLFSTPVASEHILTTTGTSLANQIVLQALLRPGDHVICVHPTYAQLYNVPRAVGAEVSFWRHRPSNNWDLDFSELKDLVRPTTRMVVVNNPNNPTGAYLNDELQRQIITFAATHNLLIMSDEIFRPLFHLSTPGSDTHQPPTDPKSMLDHASTLNFQNLIVTGSMSKSHSFPGLRLGWIISRSATIISTCTNLRFYTLNSVSPIDETIASEALSVRCQTQITTANLNVARRGRDIFEQFVVSSHRNGNRYRVEWIKPQASTTTLIRFVDGHSGRVLDDVRLCDALYERAKILLVPATLCFDTMDPDIVGDGEGMQGWCRVQFVLEEDRLNQALVALRRFLQSYDEAATMKSKI